jgi:hypothetical protein
MRRAAHLTCCLFALGTLAVAVGCGDNHPANVSDAGQRDAPEPQDAPPDDLVVKLTTACTIEFRRCEDAGTDFCLAEGLDCVPVRVDTPVSICLRRCGDTADCPFNSYCVPTKVEWGGLSLAAHHCFDSVCGKVYGNGDLFGACTVGGDNLVSLDAGQQRPGTCIPIDTDAGIGACVESGNDTTGGTAGRDEPCSLDLVTPPCPSRQEVVGCVAGTACVGGACDAVGSCALLCDPRLDPEGQCTVGAGKPKQYCQDSSLLTVGASGKLHLGYFGVCQTFPRCRLFTPPVDGGAPATGCNPADACYPTTMASTNGVCAPAGTLAAGEGCQFASDCAVGTLCVGTDACGGGTCRTLCALPDDGQSCGAGSVCVGVVLDAAQSTVMSIPWGVCDEASSARSKARPRVAVRSIGGRRR